MSYFWTCPECGANLDPGEKCNCLEIESINKKIHRKNKRLNGYMEDITNELISD